MLIAICIAYLLGSYIHSKLTFTEGWYNEGWLPFFKKLVTFKLKRAEKW
jgi:hypothetical protein